LTKGNWARQELRSFREVFVEPVRALETAASHLFWEDE
jgi:hypothetical protein